MESMRAQKWRADGQDIPPFLIPACSCCTNPITLPRTQIIASGNKGAPFWGLACTWHCTRSLCHHMTTVSKSSPLSP
jgi:hypothetical protein